MIDELRLLIATKNGASAGMRKRRGMVWPIGRIGSAEGDRLFLDFTFRTFGGLIAEPGAA
jgi:hypothetical protein